MNNSGRLRRGLRVGAAALLIASAVAWTSLYFDSIVQRRKAERLLFDLSSFPFASAGFNEVRNLVARNGGHALQSLPTGIPPGCTPRDCTFWIEFSHPLFPLLRRRNAPESTCAALLHSGIRPWIVRADLVVKGGTLSETWTSVEQVKFGEDSEGNSVLMGILYEVLTHPRGPIDEGDSGYQVSRPNVTGGPVDVLETWAVQQTGVPMSRAFDVNLRCFTTVLHSCRNFAELAPSAWADHERRK